MVKLFMPLQSLTARGTIGGVLTFSERKSGSQVRYQIKQKDIITTARTTQRNKFITAKEMWKQDEVGIAECGYLLCGGWEIRISDMTAENRAPQFARYVSDVVNFYF